MRHRFETEDDGAVDTAQHTEVGFPTSQRMGMFMSMNRLSARHAGKAPRLAVLPALILAATAAAPASATIITPGQDSYGAYAFSDLREHEVRALYSLLSRTSNARANTGDKLVLSGSEIKAWYHRGPITQDTGTNVDTAYTKNWKIPLYAESQFKLRRTRIDRLAGGSIVDNANGTRFSYKQTTSYVWDPVARTLLVSIEKPITPSSGQSLGRQTIAGTYAIEATSKTNITTVSGTTSIVNGSVQSVHPPVGSLSFGLNKTSQKQSTRVSLAIDGNPYWVDLGRMFFERRSDGATWWELGMDLVAESDVKITRPVTGMRHCTVRYRSFNANVGVGTDAPSTTPATVPDVAACNIEAANFFAEINYRAKPSTFSDSNTSEKVGQRWRVRFQANKVGENLNISRIYKFSSLTNWFLSVQGTNTAETGFAAGFDISNGEEGVREKYFEKEKKI